MRLPAAWRIRGLGRFVTTGAVVAVTYLGLTLLLSGPVGLPIALAIAIAYVIAVTLQFSGQRWFVFAHVDTFGLTISQQIRRYVVLGGAQYAVTAGATALLPGVLDVSEQVVYLGTVATISAVGFLVLRHGVFHGGTTAARGVPR